MQQQNKKCGFDHRDINSLFSIKDTTVNTDLEKIGETKHNNVGLSLTYIFKSVQINTLTGNSQKK